MSGVAEAPRRESSFRPGCAVLGIHPPGGQPCYMAAGKRCHVPQQASDPTGVLQQLGRKVHASAGAGATDQILAQIEAWTVP
ncbi:unnamed protein product [Prorocentrum cordatum]|uniref:Uncharacterized protein n=1 Tax=Prorocentrum cordatum TaxID=2364126 RepID=A0ABN9PSD4_9DINO|nr:unnamed protein product [Polarella glacialis]